MFDSKKFIGIVVRDSDGQLVFWATSMPEYGKLEQMQGIPDKGTVVTFDRYGNHHEYTVVDWLNALTDEDYRLEELSSEYPEEFCEPDWEQLQHDEVIKAFDAQREAQLALIAERSAKIAF